MRINSFPGRGYVSSLESNLQCMIYVFSQDPKFLLTSHFWTSQMGIKDQILSPFFSNIHTGTPPKTDECPLSLGSISIGNYIWTNHWNFQGIFVSGVFRGGGQAYQAKHGKISTWKGWAKILRSEIDVKIILFDVLKKPGMNRHENYDDWIWVLNQK